MTCCYTGHRPNGFPWPYEKDKKRQALYEKSLHERIESYITERGVTDFICGMALGADTDFALSVLSLRKKYPYIRLHCAIPCRTQTRQWNTSEIARYNDILKHATSTVVLSEHYTRGCMFERNRYMVDNSDYLLAIWNGSRKGGTWYTLNYAQKRHKPIEILYLEESK